MPTPEQYIDRINYGDRFIKLRTEGLTHADTMKQLPFAANCMNWNLGHIMVFRDYCLGAFKGIAGLSAINPDEYAIYGAGSERLTDDSKAMPLETLLERLDETSEQLKAALQSFPVEKYDELYNTHNGPQRLDDYLLAYVVVHEAVHLGQLEVGRKLALS